MDSLQLNNTGLVSSENHENEINLDKLEKELEEFYRNAQSNLHNIREFEELQSFLQEAHERFERFNSKIDEKEKGTSERCAEIDLKVERNKEHFKQVMKQKLNKKVREAIREGIRELEEYSDRLSELGAEEEKAEKVRALVRRRFQEIFDQGADVEDRLRARRDGLTPARIGGFELFSADKSHVGDRCAVCIEDVGVGRRMRRLTCKHYFCEGCIEGWFAEHNTCPICRRSYN